MLRFTETFCDYVVIYISVMAVYAQSIIIVKKAIGNENNILRCISKMALTLYA